MNVIPKSVAAAGFDAAAWHEELLALNPWARGLTIAENSAEFTAARQKATLARHAEGKEAWNVWANGMLALKAALEATGQWAAKRQYASVPLEGENAVTRAWLALASVVFGAETAPHRFKPGAFSEFVFPGSHSFEADVSFADFVFPSDAWFWDATFSGATSFAGAVFGGATSFAGATFRGDARFRDATFNGAARFRGATFNGPVSFAGATFSGRTFLNKVRFNATASIAEARFEEPATFAGSIFSEGASFEGTESTAAFSLDGATFCQVPSFFGATFKGGLRLDNVKTPRYRWTLGYTPDTDATARFRELRRRAVEAQDRDRELEFFAQEARTGRFHATRLPSWVPKVWSWRFWFGLAFEAFSDFGRSLWRPLLTWLVLLLGFAAFFLGEHEDMRKGRAALAPAGAWSTVAAYAATTRDAWANPPACRIAGREPFASTDAVAEAIQLSLRNALVFDVGRADSARRTYGCLFGLDQGGDQEYLRVSARVSMASTLQALASGLLIFLFLLAVRNLLRLR